MVGRGSADPAMVDLLVAGNPLASPFQLCAGVSCSLCNRCTDAALSLNTTTARAISCPSSSERLAFGISTSSAPPASRCMTRVSSVMGPAMPRPISTASSSPRPIALAEVSRLSRRAEPVSASIAAIAWRCASAARTCWSAAACSTACGRGFAFRRCGPQPLIGGHQQRHRLGEAVKRVRHPLHETLHPAIVAGALAAASGDNRRMQRFVKGMADPLDRFTKAVPLLVAADERLRTATAEREAAATAVLQAAADQQVRAAEAQRQAIAAMLADTGSARRLSLLTSASAIGLGLLLAVLIGRGIAGPITELTRVMHRLAGGALDVDIPNAKRSDELGEMARAVVVFKDNAASVQRLQREQEADRHTAEMEKRAALETMADTIETDTAAALGLICGRTTAMTAMADAMRELAVRTGAAAVTASRAAAQALANAQSVAGAAEQLSASIQEIGSQVDQSTAVVGRAVTAGTETRSTIEALNQEVEQIGAVADIIGEIAAKTNLLALNATIEAARAGDAGKGFAVVASEVKALANQTARSTQEIARHINQVRTATGASVAAVARIEETITEVNAIAGSIAAAVEQQGAATAEIARSVGETAAVANEMTMRTAEVSSEASETGRQAAEVRDNSASLGDAMEELRQSVTRVVRNSTVEVDRRGSERRTVDLPCQLTIDGQTYRARVVDLSQSGAQVQGAPALQAGLRGLVAVDGVRDALPFVVSRSVNGALGLVFTLDAASAVRFGATLAQLGHTRAA